MTDPSPETPLDTAQADRLYRGFPDFSAWGELTATYLDLWNRFASNLEERRKAATPEVLRAAAEVAIRAAALDTGAIEGLYTTDRGFTMTVALQHLAWEQVIEERGSGIRELFEAQLEAYELVLDAVTRKLPMTEAWIRSLHETLCAPQKTYRVLTEVGWQEQELPRGQYKTSPNHVRLSDGSIHAYAPVDRVPDEMHRLLGEIRTPEFEVAHPVLQASYCHYAFVVIHPFADGNGRVARALASSFFYRAESIPLVIFAYQRLAYFDALAMADRGDYQPLISLFLDRGIDTIQLEAESLMTAQMPKLEDLVPRLRLALKEKHGLALEELENIAARILKMIERDLVEQFEQLRLSSDFSLDIFGEGQVSFSPSPSGYQSSKDSLFIVLRGLDSKAETRVIPLIAKERSRPFRFTLRGLRSDDPMEIRLEDVYPETTPALQLRLSNWVQRHLTRMLADLAGKTSS